MLKSVWSRECQDHSFPAQNKPPPQRKRHMPKFAPDLPAGRINQPLGKPVQLKQYDAASPVQPLLTGDSRAVYAVKPFTQELPPKNLTKTRPA